MFARDLHVALAVCAVAALGLAAVEAAWRAAAARPPGRLSGAVSTMAVVVIGMTAAGGLAILARGGRPKEFLHFVYAVLAFVLIPLGDSLTAHASARRRAGGRLLTAVVAAGVVARLFATG